MLCGYERPFTPEDISIRKLVERVALTGEPVTVQDVRPKELGTVSCMLLVKDEWETMEQCVKSLVPLVTEIIIGIDKDTDSPLSFAYREAYLRKGGDACREFFDSKLEQGRRATMEEIAEFIGIPLARLEKIGNAMLSAGKPTVLAAQRCLDMVGNGKIVEVDFNNHFSNARNILLAEMTGDYCMFVDGHETLTNPGLLCHYILKAEAMGEPWCRMGVQVFMLDSSVQECNYQSRLWRNHLGAEFVRGVHNMLNVPGQEETSEVRTGTDCRLIHDRPAWLQYFRDPQRQQMIKQHMEGIERTSEIFYRAVTAHRAKHSKEALALYDKYLSMSPDGAEPAMACWYKGRILQAVAMDRNGAINAYMDGIKRCPTAAFCHLGIVNVLGDIEENEENEDKRNDLLDKMLTYVNFASSCEMPKSTIALPESTYTYEPIVWRAEIYRRQGRFADSVTELGKALQCDISAGYRAQLEEAMGEVQATMFTFADQELRLSRKDGKRRLLIVDPSQKLSESVYRKATEIGMVVKASPVFNFDLFYESDVAWIEGADENALAASVAYRGDRKLILRVHSDSAGEDIIGSIRFGNFDKVFFGSRYIPECFSAKHGVDTSDWAYLPVIPDPEMFNGGVDSSIRDAVILKDISVGSGFDRLPELAREVYPCKIHVGGSIRDSRQYDNLVYELSALMLDNVEFHGEVAGRDVPDFLKNGGVMVDLAPSEKSAVTFQEAHLSNMPVLALENEWSAAEEDVETFPDLRMLARTIKDGKVGSPGKAWAADNFDVAKEVIQNAILG